MGAGQRGVIIVINAAGPCIIAFDYDSQCLHCSLNVWPHETAAPMQKYFFELIWNNTFKNVNPTLDQFYIHFSDLLFCNWHEIKKVGWGLKQ